MSVQLYDESKDISCESMVRKARSIGLNVAAVCPTLGDGNCFYRAVVESLFMMRTPYPGNHINLRSEIVSFVDQNRDLEFVRNWELTIDRELDGDLESVLRRQYRNGEYASELFLLATAIKLNIIILCTKYDCSATFQYEIFWPANVNFASGLSNAEMIRNFPGTTIIISHKRNHFQSLYFLDDTLNQPAPHLINNDIHTTWDRMKNVNIKAPPEHSYARQFVQTNNKPSYAAVLKGQHCQKTQREETDKNLSRGTKRKQTFLQDHDYAVPTLNFNCDESAPKKSRKSNVADNREKQREEINDILRSIFTDKNYVERKISESSSFVDFTIDTKSKGTDVKKPPCCSKTSRRKNKRNSENTASKQANLEASIDPINHEHSTSNVQLHANPAVEEAIKEFNSIEKLHTVQKCSSCLEVRPYYHIVNNKEKLFDKDKCKRCWDDIANNKKSNHTNRALMFSGINSLSDDCYKEKDVFYHNNQHFLEIPPYLANLTFVETLLIRKISVAIYVHCLKYGMLASKGHAVSIPHDLRIFKQLPQLPTEVGILLLRSGNKSSKAYMASRKRVQDALDGLIFGYPKYGLDAPRTGFTRYNGKNHVSGVVLNGKYFLYQPNQYYWDVVIDFERLSHIPEKQGLLQGLPVISTSKEKNEEEDLGPGPKQFDSLEEDEELVSTSGFAAQLTNIDVDENIRNALRLFLGENKSQMESLLQQGAVADMGKLYSGKKEKPVPELSTEGFFTMTYPHIFINGTCDITIPSQRTIDYDSWVDHVYHCKDNRVPSHRFLKFHLLNIGLRKKALNQGDHCVRQQINEKQLTRDELLQKLENDDDSIPRKFISMCANLINTDPYWRERKYELDALCFFLFKEEDVFPTYFDTSSCAEHHWVALHDIIINYVSQMTGEDIKQIQDRFSNDSQFRHQTLLLNQHIVTSYFNARHLNYKSTVLKELFQFEDDWSRFEFAKSRGAIHSHSLYFSKHHYNIVKSILDQDPNEPGVDIARDLEKWLQSTELNGNGIFSPEFVSMHPAGGKFTVDEETQERQWVPNTNQWPPPDGTFEENNPNTLKDCVLCKKTEESLRLFQVDVVNKVMLHRCSKYCLRRKTVSTKERDESGRLKKKIVRYCRHHFGEYNESTKRSSGKQTDPFKPRLIEGKIPRYKGRNDHPRMVQHILTRPLSWLGQCDTQAIVSKDLLALIKYITGYCCKGATTTAEFMNIYRSILDKSESNITLKSVAQKLILKAVSFVDTPSSCADYINTRGKLYQCSRRFRRIGLSGFRLFDPKGNKDGEVTRKSPLDKFLSEERRQKYPDISLYDWAKICNCPNAKKCGKDHVPVFTGCQKFWKWPVSETFAKELLMKFSPGTWHEVDDLKHTFETFTESFADFLDSDICPEAVKMMLKLAKVEFDKKMEKINRNRCSDDAWLETDSLKFSQSTENSQSSQESNIDTFGNQLLRDIAFNHRIEMANAEVEEPVLFAGSQSFDWHVHAKTCLNVDTISNENYEEMKGWLSNVSSEATAAFERSGRQCNLPEVDPKLVNRLQMIIVHYNLRVLLEYARKNISVGYENCKRLIVQGCAGTGKSQIIKILTRMVRRMFQCNRSILNVAPTGAAAVLLPNGGTIHSAVHIPRNTGSHTCTLLDKPMSADKFKELKSTALDKDEQLSLMCINADERGMVGNYTLAWFHQRFVELSIRLLEHEGEVPFGCIPTFNFFGDIFQLGAIGSSNLGDPVLDSTTPIEAAGNLVYRNFEDVVILEEIMRQKPDQMALLKRLENIRTGNVTRKDWEEINARSLNALNEEEKQNFDSEISNVVCLTETWNEAKKHNKTVLNSKYVNGNRAVIAEIISTGVGRHHSSEKESMSQIPNISIVAAGCRVILTKNQGSLTRLGLNNGALGTVVSIVYKEGVKPPAFPEVIVVDFPKYKGPSWNPEHPTWVPIPLNKVFCDNKCCHREGFPLITGYALTINKSQGMTIGRNQQITNAIIKLSPNIGMEAKNYGIAYTAFSRVTEDADWCLAEPIPFERLEYLNRHPKKKVRQAEEKRLKDLSQKTVHDNSCSVNQYIDLIKEIDAFCNDGIDDAICNDPDGCQCILHKQRNKTNLNV